MTAEEVKRLIEENAALREGQRVKVRWGYGLGFRVEGQGVITKLFPKSLRVRLEHEVRLVGVSGSAAWPAGFELKGIPRFSVMNTSWSEWNCVEPLGDESPTGWEEG